MIGYMATSFNRWHTIGVAIENEKPPVYGGVFYSIKQD